MGKLSSQPEPTINHFSHQHPLNLSNHQPQQTNFHAMNQSSCSACKLNLSPGLIIYTCRPCNYNLHINCAQMPMQIKHQFHQQHTLSLLPKPAYSEGLFSCDACGKHCDGFSYHCRACKIDLHIKCASMPLKVSNQSHHHNLDLTFSAPYPNNVFSCDLCKNMGSNEWLYRCNSCEFDCHLNCATIEPRAQVLGTQLPEMPNSMNIINNQGVHGNVAEQNVFFNQLMQQMASDNSNASLQAMQDLICGGNGGNGGGVNYMLAMMGDGSGGGADMLQAIMSGGYGGSGGVDIFQAMLGGGSGGGEDILQAMMGGGGGAGMTDSGSGGGAGNLLQTLMGGGSGGGANLGGDPLPRVADSLSTLGGIG